MVAQSTQAEVSDLTQREIECGHRLAAAMFAMGKQQASIGARMSKIGNFDRSAIMLLKSLVHQGPTRSSTLAAAVHSDPSTVSRQVAALVRDGYTNHLCLSQDHLCFLAAPRDPYWVPKDKRDSFDTNIRPGLEEEMFGRPHTFLFTDFWPKLEARGMDRKVFDSMLTDNPKTLFGG